MRDKIHQGYDFSDENFGLTGLSITLWLIRFVLFAIIVVSAWSYNETQDFFTGNDVPWMTFYGVGAISHSLAILFQYGQSPLFYLFLRFAKKASIRRTVLRRTSFDAVSAQQVARYTTVFWQDAVTATVFLFSWLLFCFVDGGSNVIQVNKNQYETEWSHLVMSIVAVGSIFIEELFMFILDVAKALHSHISLTAATMPPAPSIIGERLMNGLLGLKKAAGRVSQQARVNQQASPRPTPKPVYPAVTPQIYPKPRSGAVSGSVHPTYHGVQKGFPLGSFPTDYDEEAKEPRYEPI
jgi:hypothetical protein